MPGWDDDPNDGEKAGASWTTTSLTRLNTRSWLPRSSAPDIADSLGLKKAAGALVSEPQANSPAAKAGIASGDVITSVDGVAVRDAPELSRKIGTMAPGTWVKFGLIHDGQEKTVTLTLGTLPNEKQAANQQKEDEVPDSDVPKLGLRVATSNLPALSLSALGVVFGDLMRSHGRSDPLTQILACSVRPVELAICRPATSDYG
jgi:membrane-associated protease RseP (regulator of RpoE activity)